MKRRHLLYLLAGVLLAPCLQAVEPDAPIRPSDYAAPVKVACVGDSITEGAGTVNRPTDSYPAQLRRLLGDGWNVGNFGKGGRTLLNAGDFPYQTTGPLKEALAFQPDVVVIMLGTNDSKPQNWKFKDQFVADYKDLIGKFRALPTKPRIFICRPIPVVGVHKFQITAAGVEEQLPLIAQIAKEEQTGVIDMRAAFEGHDEWLPDGVHPNNEGAARLAQTVFKALTGKVAPAEQPAAK